LLNSIEIPFNKEFKNTVVGGLSSIDYDSKTIFTILFVTIERYIMMLVLYCQNTFGR
jgi:hypothetical protein